jgi:phosphoesterase RecJ-like protein
MRHANPPPPAWPEIAAALERSRRILVTTHVNPDGDGLGAELGVWAHLRSRGKDVRIVNPDPLSDRYRFLAEHGNYEVFDPAEHETFIAASDAVIVLDISRWDRLGALGERLSRVSAVKICIDHHPFEANGMADLYAVDLGAAATGQLVYEMVRDQGHPLDRTMALGFYISILTDTGSFRFSNSDPRAHRAAAELLEHGLEPSELYEAIYGNSSLERLRLLGEVLRTLRVEHDGRLLLVVIPAGLLARTRAVPADTEGIVDVVRTARGSEVVALFMERADGQVKLSLRSRGRANVNRVAAQFGGGGHILASGGTVPGPLEEAVERVAAALRAEIDRSASEPRS